MKSMKVQIKDASVIVLGFGSICIVLSLMACAPVVGPKGDVGAAGAKGDAGVTGNQGDQGNTGSQGDQGFGAGMQVTQLSSGDLNCPNGGIKVVNFQDLNNNGLLDSGESLLGLTYACNGAAGANGTNGSNGVNGTNGVNGSNGTNGTNGIDGVSSTFNIVAATLGECPTGGFDLTLTDSTHNQTTTLCNGINGASGQAGTNGTNGANGGTITFNLVQAIEPCGAASSPWKEVILGLQGGQLLSSFSDNASGSNTRFAFIPNGSYTDTDSSGCQFTVTGNGVTTSDISWSGGGYSWTPATGWVAHN